MFSDVHLKNFGPFSEFRWKEHGSINVVVGENDTGKSYLLRVMYAFAKSVEDLATKQRREAEERTPSDRFIEKLKWTLQAPQVSALLRRGTSALDVEVVLTGKTYSFRVARVKHRPATTRIATGFEAKPQTVPSAVFLPPKEVLTPFAAIDISRSKHEIYGFDDTYYDLLKLLRIPPTRGKIAPQLASVIRDLEAFYGGQIVKPGITDEFVFVRNEGTYTMPETADGIKKLGILTMLLKSRSIAPGTILLLDEPETNLHPRAIAVFTNVLFRLAQAGVQVYLATHSYFVLKQLEIRAKQHGTSVPICSLARAGSEIEARFDDLREGMPDGPIIEESLRLYQEGIDVDMKR